ncbi:MAG: hypothetical protein H0W53_20780 [Acidobacteria bacterium]|nr:hypothetical protein [Acidobacteriota bacterium]
MIKVTYRGTTIRALRAARDVGGHLAGRDDRINDVLKRRLKRLNLVFKRAEAVKEFEFIR